MRRRLLVTLFSGAAILVTGILSAEVPSALNPPTVGQSSLDIQKVFQGAPIIYSILMAMSVIAFVIWLYSLLTLKLNDMIPKTLVQEVSEQLTEKRFEAALTACKEDQSFSSSILASGIAAREHGPRMVMEAMQAEGRRSGVTLWQRLSLLNEIAVVAPMLGLLGTVVGMFYAFYDMNRSQESIAAVFDGLGIALGTTVVGLIVSILATTFYTTLKHRLVRLLNAVESRALDVANLIVVEEEGPSRNKQDF